MSGIELTGVIRQRLKVLGGLAGAHIVRVAMATSRNKKGFLCSPVVLHEI